MLTGMQSQDALDTVEESEELNFNAHRMSDNADDFAIENFLAGQPTGIGSTVTESKRKQTTTTKTGDSGGGFTSVRWHDQGSQ